MYYSEFKEEVESLSSKYCVGRDEGYTIVSFYSHGGYQDVIDIDEDFQYTVDILESVEQFNKLPFSNKLYMLVSELAVTPVKERTPEGQMLAIVEHRRNREVSMSRHATRKILADKHNSESPARDKRPILFKVGSYNIKPKGAIIDNKKEYTGIKDAKGKPINVGDTVVEVFNFKDIPNMPDFKEKGEPFIVKKDCYLYSHWIASGVAKGSNFGVNNFLFGSQLLKKGDNNDNK